MANRQRQAGRETGQGAASDPSDLLKLENQLCFPLYACAKEVVRRYKPMLDGLDLTYTQYLAMMALWEEDSLSVSGLGERLYLDSGTLTPLLKKLEAKGLCTRSRSTDDERKVIVSITEKGRRLRERAAGVPRKMASCVGLSLDEATQLRGLLDKVLSNVAATHQAGVAS